MHNKMIDYFERGYGIDRTFGRLREDGWAVEHDFVACEYQEFHKNKNL